MLPEETSSSQQRLQEPRWSLIKKYLQAPSADQLVLPIPYAECPICDRELGIAGIPRLEPPSPDAPVPGVVLICDHMMCKECWSILVALEEEDGVEEEDEEDEEDEVEEVDEMAPEESDAENTVHVRPDENPDRGPLYNSAYGPLRIIVAPEGEYVPPGPPCPFRCDIEFGKCVCEIPPYQIPTAGVCRARQRCLSKIPPTYGEPSQRVIMMACYSHLLRPLLAVVCRAPKRFCHWSMRSYVSRYLPLGCVDLVMKALEERGVDFECTCGQCCGHLDKEKDEPMTNEDEKDGKQPAEQASGENEDSESEHSERYGRESGEESKEAFEKRKQRASQFLERNFAEMHCKKARGLWGWRVTCPEDLSEEGKKRYGSARFGEPSLACLCGE
ncbi:hypothetical protein QBC42DRAFT_250757 [Cladorrhinum samala]|uniref:RING-type domain-containing protein n=1 Tax=Cladorrhinum samala TaxID=585594 RepID=A0AAV9HUT0_9PEZI|nr:hypothetical protein QBC42DRAFT_250757 [Cladorrhinum samala]